MRIPESKKTAKQTVLSRLPGLTYSSSIRWTNEFRSGPWSTSGVCEQSYFFFGFPVIVVPKASDRSTTSAGTALIIQDLITAPSTRQGKAGILVF